LINLILKVGLGTAEDHEQRIKAAKLNMNGKDGEQILGNEIHTVYISNLD
jgi:hypothetical protein